MPDRLRSFCKSWKEGVGAATVVSNFMYKAVGKIISVCMHELSTVLDELKPQGMKMKMEKGPSDSPKALLDKVITPTCIATLVGRLRTDDLSCAKAADSQMHVQVPSEWALAPLVAIEPHCSEQMFPSQAFGDEAPAALGKVLAPALQLYSHVVSLLAIAGLLAEFGDGVYAAIYTKTTKDGQDTMYVTPLLATCLQWLIDGVGLNYVQAKGELEKAEGFKL